MCRILEQYFPSRLHQFLISPMLSFHACHFCLGRGRLLAHCLSGPGGEHMNLTECATNITPDSYFAVLTDQIHGTGWYSPCAITERNGSLPCAQETATCKPSKRKNLTFVLILSSHLSLGLPSRLSPSGILTKNYACIFQFSLLCSYPPIATPFFKNPNNRLLNENHQPWNYDCGCNIFSCAFSYHLTCAKISFSAQDDTESQSRRPRLWNSRKIYS